MASRRFTELTNLISSTVSKRSAAAAWKMGKKLLVLTLLKAWPVVPTGSCGVRGFIE